MTARRVAALGLVAALAGCYHGPWDPGEKTAPAVTRSALNSPCADTSYQRMKRTPVDSLSQREFEIFRMHDAACLEFQSRGTGQPR